MTNPWLVPVTSLRRSSLGTVREERRSGPVGELRVGDSVVEAKAAATAVAVLTAIDGGIEVAAEVDAPWVGECRRCLKPLTGELHCEVRELYRPRTPSEAADEDDETYSLTGEQLDLRPLVRDALLLELPLAPLCRPGCLGLCPTCGADLNEGDCGCPETATDPRWAVLDVLRDDSDRRDQ
jgi:DUF177 domain-containing protein